MALWIVAPEDHGQTVEVSYCMIDGIVYRQRHDRSDGAVEYHASDALAGDEGDYQNGAPRNRRWRRISGEAVPQ